MTDKKHACKVEKRVLKLVCSNSKVQEKAIQSVMMTTSCCADTEPSDTATPNKQRRRASNRIKLTRDLMIRLTAALSNGSGGQVVAESLNGASVITDEQRHQTNNGFFIERRGCSLNCDISSQQLEEISHTNKSSSSSIFNKKSKLTHSASSIENDCSSILAINQKNSNETDKNKHDDTCHQAISMPVQKSSPMQTREQQTTSAATSTAAGANDNDNSCRHYNICAATNYIENISQFSSKDCATSNRGKYSDAATENNTKLIWKKPAATFTGFSKSPNDNVGNNTLLGSRQVATCFLLARDEPSTLTNYYGLNPNKTIINNEHKPASKLGLQKQSAIQELKSRKKQKQQQHCNAGKPTSSCLVEGHESFDIHQICPSWRDKRQQRGGRSGARNGRGGQEAANCSSNILQMLMLNSIDYTSSTIATKNNSDLNFNDSNLTPNSKIRQRRRDKEEQQQRVGFCGEGPNRRHHDNLVQDFQRQRHVFKRKQQEQQLVADKSRLSSGNNSFSSKNSYKNGGNFAKLDERSSSVQVIKVDPKLNLSIETKTGDKSLFLNEDEGEEEEEEEEEDGENEKVTGIVSNCSSVIILKAIKVDLNLHLNSNLSSYSIRDSNNDERENCSARDSSSRQEGIIHATTSSKISSEKQAHILCFSPKPLRTIVEDNKIDNNEKKRKKTKAQVGLTTSNKQQVVGRERGEKREEKENLLINTTKKINTRRKINHNNIRNSRNSSYSYSNTCKISSESFECDNITSNNLNLIGKKQEACSEIKKEEVAGFEKSRKKVWQPEISKYTINSNINANDDLELVKSLSLDWKCVKRIGRGKSYQNRNFFIWFSMILFGCLLLRFESNSNSGWPSSFGLVSPLGRVSGQSTSDEFSRAVLATMTTQSPSNNSIGHYDSTSSSPDEVDSYLDQSPRVTNNNELDQQHKHQQQQQQQQQQDSSVLDKFLDFGRIFIIGAIIIGDICGNSLVILSVCRHSKLRVTTNWFVVSLACADILVAVFAMTFNASVIISGRWLFKPWVCDFWNSCDVLASTASILHLCCISIDRYIAITRPLDYPMKITTRRVIYALCGVWISSALLSYLPIFTGVYTTAEHIKWLNDNPEQCDFVVNRVYAIVSSSISFWIPSSIMVFTYYRIYKEATRQEKFMYKQQSMMPAPMANHHRDHHVSGNHFSKSANRAKQRRSKSMAVSTSSTSNTFSSNEARIRQLAKQQQELQPSSALRTLGSTLTPASTTTAATATTTTTTSTTTAATNQRQTNSFNSLATTNLNSTISIPESTAQNKQTSFTNDSSAINKSSNNRTVAPGSQTTTERASSLLQLSAPNATATENENQPLTAPTTTTTSLSVPPDNSNNGVSDKTVATTTTTTTSTSDPSNKLNQSLQFKKQSPAVAFDEGEEDDEDDDQDSNSGQSTPTKRSISKMKREHKAAKTLGIIMGVFILCWLPFFSWYTPQHICGHACDGIVPPWAVTILFWIGYFNSTLNPIIYAYFNHEFRDAFKKTLQWIFCCCNDLKCLRVNRPNDNQHYNCTYRSTQEIGLVSNG